MIAKYNFFNYECRPFVDTYNSTTDDRYAVSAVEQAVVNAFSFLSMFCRFHVIRTHSLTMVY